LNPACHRQRLIDAWPFFRRGNCACVKAGGAGVLPQCSRLGSSGGQFPALGGGGPGRRRPLCQRSSWPTFSHHWVMGQIGGLALIGWTASGCCNALPAVDEQGGSRLCACRADAGDGVRRGQAIS
jgi:hypothetical protein